jgi:predicted CopG family antitoxin
LATVITAASAERRKRLKLKRIVISEHNYLALKRLGYTGDSFNDVISKLLRIQRNYQEKQQESNDNSSNDGLPFPGSLSELFDNHDTQQLAELLGLRRSNNSSKMNNQKIKQESNS